MGRPSLEGLQGRGPAEGLVSEDEGIYEGHGGLPSVLVEGGEGLEPEPELLVGDALVLLKHEGVGDNLLGTRIPAVPAAGVAQPARR